MGNEGKRRGEMSKRLALIAAVSLALVIFAGVALAGITSAIVRTDTNQVRLTITENKADNFYSGWHTHPGPVIVQVQKGYLKFYHGVENCAPDVVGPGGDSGDPGGRPGRPRPEAAPRSRSPDRPLRR